MAVAETPKVHPESRLLIDGKLVDAATGKTFDNVNPATEEVLGQVADASPEDMERAIAAARRAFDETDWSTDRAFRQRCLRQLQEALQADREELREELILEVGCPRMLTLGPQLDAPLDGALSYPIQLIDEYGWEIRPPRCRRLPRDQQFTPHHQGTGRRGRGHRPVELPVRGRDHQAGSGPGHGEHRGAQAGTRHPLERDAAGPPGGRTTDIPPGVLNVVASSDHMVGEQLTLSPQVDLISFTGSTAVGKRIMEKGAATLKRLFLELGGKSATIVLDDADFSTALLSGLAVCSHAGQGCAIPTRMLLPRSRYEEGVEFLSSIMPGLPYGDPQRADVIMGPLISEKQRARVLGYIEKGVEEGATLALGGNRPSDQPRGWYVEPTLFTNVDNSMTIAQEEIFGPVLAVIPSMMTMTQ